MTEKEEKTAEIVRLAEELIRIPSVTVGDEIRWEAVHQAIYLTYDYLRRHGLDVRIFSDGAYPAVFAGFPGQITAPVMLSGHVDVVAPEPDDSQFEPSIEGDYLFGRGSADMKTVVATYMVWMKDMLTAGPPYPQVSLLLVSNEENGEAEPMGTPHVLKILNHESGYVPDLFIAGERTEEVGDGLWGEVCIENRGVGRFTVVAQGERGHSGMSSLKSDLTQRIIEARKTLSELAAEYLTLDGAGGWKSQIRFPFIQVGSPGVYNITPDYGQLGVEIRMIPQDRPREMLDVFQVYCQENGLAVEDVLLEGGVRCMMDNPYLQDLLQGIETVKGSPAAIGKKLAGTSARFAPGGGGVVWGQSGIGPHAKGERHFIPSIYPYYQALTAFGKHTLQHTSIQSDEQ